VWVWARARLTGDKTCGSRSQGRVAEQHCNCKWRYVPPVIADEPLQHRAEAPFDSCVAQIIGCHSRKNVDQNLHMVAHDSDGINVCKCKDTTTEYIQPASLCSIFNEK